MKQSLGMRATMNAIERLFWCTRIVRLTVEKGAVTDADFISSALVPKNEYRGLLRSMKDGGMLVTGSKVLATTPGCNSGKKVYHYALSPVMEAGLKGRTLPSEAEVHENIALMSDRMHDGEDGRKFLLEAFGLKKEEIDAIWKEYFKEEMKVPEKTEKEKLIDVKQILKEMGGSVRGDVCEDAYRIICKAGQHGAVKTEIRQALYDKHRHWYSLAQIDKACKVLIKGLLVIERDVNGQIVAYPSYVVPDVKSRGARRLGVRRSEQQRSEDKVLILEALRDAEGTMRHKDISYATDIPGPTVYKMLCKLIDEGLVKRVEDGETAVSYALADYESACRIIREKENPPAETDNGHTYEDAKSVPTEDSRTPEPEVVPEPKELPQNETTVTVTAESEEGVAFEQALSMMYTSNKAMISLASGYAYFVGPQGLACSARPQAVVRRFTDDERAGRWVEMPTPKKCPYCGSAGVLRTNDAKTEYWCKCVHDDCGASTARSDRMEIAVQKWNRRC